MEDILARRLFKEQVRKELIDEILKHEVGVVFGGRMFAALTSDIRNGHMLIIPDEQYRELVGGR